MAVKNKTDWERCEKEYARGIRSNCDLANEFGVSETAIRKRAKQYGWVKDLSAKIKLKTEAKVRKIEFESHGSSSIDIRTEAEIVESEAEQRAGIHIRHRKHIVKFNGLADALFEELYAQTINKDDFVKLGELMRNEDQQSVDKLNELYRKVIATPSRVDSTKKLSETLKTLIGLERQAYGLSDNSNGEADKEPITEVVYRFVDPT